MIRHLRSYTDGGARGNPGPAGIGAALYSVHEDGTEELVAEVSEYIGETTNNVAEYKALIAALEKAKTLEPAQLDLRMDSELIERQLKGQYKVKSPHLAPLFMKVMKLLQSFKSIDIKHVRRERNGAADALVNLAIDAALAKK